MNICYKVVNELFNSDYYYSTTSILTDVIYKINEWAYTLEENAKYGYYLLAFDTLKNAKFFQANLFNSLNISNRIFKAEYNKIMPLKPILYEYGIDSYNVEDILENREKIKRKSKNEYKLIWYESNNSGWPEGTIMVDKIKLIERVD
ncbi:MAG: hypothetical protein ACTSQG_05820 [Promethearchaeota archaeon]